ncbi:MAG: YeeE/YedE family protein [Geminicoccaceae bacterium]
MSLQLSAVSPVRSADGRVVAAAMAVIAALCWAAEGAGGAGGFRLVLLGAAMGLVLYHASFGFTAAWRRFIVTGEGRGLRAQMVMLAVAVLLFFPALDAGELFGERVGGFVMPAGTSVAVGAFIFGIGMQLGGGCASGTLFTVGGGSVRMVVTLVFFVIGSVIGTAHLAWWLALPSFGAYSFIHRWGLGPALAVNLGLFAAIFLLTIIVERRRGTAAPVHVSADWLRGPWPLLAGAIGLALLNFATLWIAHRPWGVTSGFALWGAKGFALAGADMAGWPYWEKRMAAIEASIFRDTTSVMNFGIMAGAMLAAGLAGRFKPSLRLSAVDLLTAIIGGLLLGYGARLAFGCNIGAFFSGIASGSLHGWLWLVTGFAGNVCGAWLRPRVGLSPV